MLFAPKEPMAESTDVFSAILEIIPFSSCFRNCFRSEQFPAFSDSSPVLGQGAKTTPEVVGSSVGDEGPLPSLLSGVQSQP